MPKVSIVLPVYNGAKYISQSVESVISQTYQDWELIIVNDCSTDNTSDIIQKYADKDNRIKIINNDTNQKLPMSLNIGFRKASGQYFTWTSDDNLFKPNALSYMVDFLDKNTEFDFINCLFDIITEDGSVIGTSQDWYRARNIQELMYYNNIGACFLYRSSAARKVGEYDTETFLAEDYDYWMRMAAIGDIYFSDQNLYKYRVHSKSLTAQKKKKILSVVKKVKIKNIPALAKKLGVTEKDTRRILSEVKKKNKIFNISKDQNHRIITLLGLKIKVKRKQKQEKQINYLEKYKLAKNWIKKYTINDCGIAVESGKANIIYPEVTGYYIPSLLKFGDRERAIAYGNFLLTLQNKEGSWNEASGRVPYTFDTGMILKGLLALIDNGLDVHGKYKEALIKGADYIISMQRDDGSIATADYGAWKLPYEKNVPEAIHIYCLEPIRYVGKITGASKYEDCVRKALDYYLAKIDLTDFTTLSHFNAYIIEGLIDIGQIARAQRAMDLISLHQRENGMIPAYPFVDFVCSTGLFQYAICWYKLGNIDKADKAFDYACRLQNKSGGWFGSYTVGHDKANYFPKGEIAWAVKYFLDAIYYGQKAKYDKISDIFLDEIDTSDERYKIVEDNLSDKHINRILDLGAGKGRYTKHLMAKFSDKDFYCVDLSEKLIKRLPDNINKKFGTILNIPYPDNSFDCVFCCEALEHCIDLEFAIKEICRVLAPGGKLIIVDKNIKNLGKLRLADFEQWFDEAKLKRMMENLGLTTTVVRNLAYEDGKKDNLFSAWIGKKSQDILDDKQ